MHYHAEIWIPSSENIEGQIESILAPYDEELEIERQEEDGEVWFSNPNGFLDWWQIGGRYTGYHTNYNPRQDPENIETCWLCQGTGFRNDQYGILHRQEDPTYTCNGCGQYNEKMKQWEHGPYGSGKRLKWPTDFRSYNGDIIPVAQISEELTCWTLIIKDQVFRQQVWNGKTNISTGFDGKVKPKLLELGVLNGYLVTVDYHN